MFHRAAQVNWPYKKAAPTYKLTLTYQGCAEAGVCYPPVDTSFEINGNGLYQPQSDEPISAKDRFLQPDSAKPSPAAAPKASQTTTAAASNYRGTH